MLHLLQFDLWAWATYTDTKKVAMLLGALPPQLARQHEKARALLTSPYARNLCIHFKSTLALPNPLSLPFPPPFPLDPFPPRLTTSTVKYVRAHLTNTRCCSVTYVTQDGISTAFSHPLPLIHRDSGNAPYVSLATSFPSQLLSTFAFLRPSSILTLIKMLHTTMTPCNSSALQGYPLQKKKNLQKNTSLSQKTLRQELQHPWDTHYQFSIKTLLSIKKKKTFLHTLPPAFWPRTQMHASPWV